MHPNPRRRPGGRHTAEAAMADETEGSIELTELDEQWCSQSAWDFSDLRALFINCTLKRSPERSHTEGLGRRAMEIMRRQGVEVDHLRAVDHDIATGVWPDMTEHGWASDEWPSIFERVLAADILV